MRLINNMFKGFLNLVMTLLVMATPLMAIIYASSPAVIQKENRGMLKLPSLFVSQPKAGSGELTKQVALTTPIIELLLLDANAKNEVKEQPAKYGQNVVPPAAR